MAKDFRANQTRTHKIIGSGSNVSAGVPSILVYSASSATDFDGSYETNMLASVGSDVFLFVSGAQDGTGKTAFGGDVVISGTLYAETIVVEVEETTTGSFSVSGSLFVSQSATINEGATINASQETGTENDFSVYAGSTRAIFVKADGTDIDITTDAGTSETITITNTQGTANAAIKLDAQAGGVDIDAAAGEDVAIAGGQVAILSKDNVANAITLNTTIGTTETITIQNDLGTSASAIKINSVAGGVDIDAAAGKIVNTGGGKIQFFPKDNAASAFYVSTDNGISETIALENIQGTSESAIQFAAQSGGVDIDAGTKVTINASDTAAITGSDAGTAAVQVYAFSGGVDIAAAQGVYINSEGAGLNPGINIGTATSGVPVSIGHTTSEVTINDNLTVTGDLTVNGTTTTIDTNNLVIKDPLIYLASGTTSTTRSAIAFASGSSTTDLALIFGAIGTGDTMAAARFDAEAGSATLDASSFNSLVPLRAAKFEVGGTTAYITQSVSGEMSIEAPQVEIGIANGITNFAVTGSTVKFGNLSAEYGFEIPGMPGNDTFFFVSGSVGGVPNGSGVAVFGGDVVISGTLYGGSPLIIGSDVQITGTLDIASSAALKATALSGSLTKLTDGTSYLIAGSGISITSGSNGSVTITNDGTVGDITSVTAGTGLSGGGSSGDVTLDIDDSVVATVSGTTFTGDTVHQSITVNEYITASLFHQFSGETFQFLSANSPEYTASDTILFISGNSAGSANEGRTVVGGNLVVSGVYRGGYSTAINDNIVQIFSPITVIRGAETGLEAASQDTSFYVSGAIGGKDGATRSVAVFGGDVVISGTLHGGSPLIIGSDVQITGTLDIASSAALKATALSGSLTKLTDGTSYLIAGTDIAITTGSNGAVTIASTGGGGGTPSAPDTSVQFNNGGSFGGNANFIFDDTNSRLFIKHVAVNEYVTASLFTQYVGDAFQFVGDGGAENNATDIAFYVSGSQGKAYGVAADVAVFGGDLVVSGGIYGGVSQSGDEEVSIFADHVSVGITEPGTDTFLHVSGAIGGIQSGNGVAVFGGDVVSSGSIRAEEYFIGSLHQQFSGQAFQFLGAGASEITATDVAFYVSGAQGKAFGQAADVAVFGGDLVVSGGLYGGESGFGGTELSIYAESISIGETEPGQDTFLYVSGAVGGKQIGNGVTVFGGDTVFSGTIFNPGMSADTGGAAVKIGSTFNELFYETSDARIKTDISTIDDGLNKVQNLRGVTFRNSQRENSETEVGLIAQEVQTIVPELVTTTPSGYLQVDYAKMVAVLIEAVKEQQTTIQALENRILALEEK